ncbi:hypothetical protein MJO28_014318 [Puccinia striiformis f. sp. tritici]|uniref:Thioredoxin domain-containing protein n=4 Tax=Puccinia striiformis TaxID=27350 RepID=A0A0L0W3V3_9BASI|nr:hypothetical protein Pst134EA_026772 [Puccinia striiformis f. sp. tritici]KAI9616526.1 hypothetical protein H4Q26_010922 [Puccinia striiformis f. sp. tritici PST-130]KNF06152.1 hypothetical protein PSTG_00660 [Puccinia striiformis f. sp. tritici PST-78]POW14653.1 hypothetical protein PSTT_02776 [Puccinia striiformis]KAH9442984.1 hypothetical protein Pst134EB_027334 [Puccinia striiformis f. sp. tritici]KAH9450060.1 hypothetical protein Pst134EA_026772 [Puccinia striiformis f. sp. tritici]
MASILSPIRRCCCQGGIEYSSSQMLRVSTHLKHSLNYSRPRFVGTTPASPTGGPEAPARSSTTPFPQPAKSRRPDRNVVSLALFITTGVGIYVYFKNEKLKVEEKKREERANKSVGQVKIGGPFELVNAQDGKPFTEKDLLGKFSLIYFGFTNCPDICPEELDKMCAVINRLAEDKDIKIPIQPIFISVDPNRDTPEAIAKYLEEFDSKMIGLTGNYESIKKMCKVYRVYFSTPPNVKPGEDYLVDHSIFFYFMAPNGNFVDAFGKIFSKDEVYTKVHSYVTEWSKGKRYGEEDI